MKSLTLLTFFAHLIIYTHATACEYFAEPKSVQLQAPEKLPKKTTNEISVRIHNGAHEAWDQRSFFLDVELPEGDNKKPISVQSERIQLSHQSSPQKTFVRVGEVDTDGLSPSELLDRDVVVGDLSFHSCEGYKDLYGTQMCADVAASMKNVALTFKITRVCNL
jgi:hypothetical protein